MRSCSRQERKLQRGAVETLGVGVFILILLFCGGCGEKSAPPKSHDEKKSADGETKREDSGKSPVSSASSLVKTKRPELISGETAERLLREMVATYQKAKLYSDHGIIESVLETTDRKRLVERTPCSIIFKKPNYVRMEIGAGLLVCDGEKIRARLLDWYFGNQLLERPAPLIFSSIRELYPDMKLADAMDLQTPANIFWPAPSLILLLAKEPLRTLVPKDARVELLEPDWFLPDSSMESDAAPVACDRIAVTAEDGTRTLWINRATKGLVRFDFPLELLAVPEGVERVVSLSMIFARQNLSENPQEVSVEPELFTLERRETEELVEPILPPELLLYGKPSPTVRLEPMFSGYSPTSLESSNGKYRVITLWAGASDATTPMRALSRSLIAEVERTRRDRPEGEPVEWLSVNVDPADAETERILSDYGSFEGTVPLYRITPTGLQKTGLARIPIPSVLFLDDHGVVQKIFSPPAPLVKLDYQLTRLLAGHDLFPEDFLAFETLATEFHRTVEAAERADLYRIEPPNAPTEPVIAPFELPKTFRLEKLWGAELVGAGNPLAIPDGGLPGEPIPTDLEKPFADIVVPCEGNTLALFDRAGNLLAKKRPETAAGEPIGFVRTTRTRFGERFFAASSFLESRRIHLFDAQFELIGSLGAGEPRQQWVADALLTDTNDDGRPDLVMALVGDASANLLPVHGIYVVPISTTSKPETVWKDERFITPYKIVQRNSPDSEQPEIVAMNFPVDEMGKLVRNALDGKRIGEIDPPAGVSILTFAADPDGNLIVMIFRSGGSAPLLARLNADGTLMWEKEIADATWNHPMERIVFGDVTGDGSAELLIPTSEGGVFLFDADGTLRERFAMGAELTGLAFARWDGADHLITTTPTGVTVWKIEKRVD